MSNVKPNIVFIHVDQLHHKAISAYGCNYVNTPNLDRMAGEGYSFMESYCSMPQCSPSRASWFTGRMSKEHGVVTNGYPLDPAIPDLGQWLRKAGYETVYSGKWHIPGRDVSKSFNVLHLGSGVGELSDSTLARSAVAYLHKRKGNNPFFMSVGFLNPHDCCFHSSIGGGPGKYAFAPKIRDKLPPLPENFDYNYKKTGLNKTRDWSLLDWQYYIYIYYRLVEMIDAEIGKVYTALCNSRYAKNTIFIFASDHGEGLGSHGKVNKGYLKEEASRTPVIVCWPGKIQRGIKDTLHLVSGVDIAATICDYANTPPLPKMTIARSWRPLLEGKAVDWRDHVICETSMHSLSTSVRDKKFKSIFYENKVEFYDIQKDPLERKDLANSPKYENMIKQHRKLFKEYVSRIETYPGPPGSKSHNNHGSLYRAYFDWYGKVKSEI